MCSPRHVGSGNGTSLVRIQVAVIRRGARQSFVVPAHLSAIGVANDQGEGGVVLALGQKRRAAHRAIRDRRYWISATGCQRRKSRGKAPHAAPSRSQRRTHLLVYGSTNETNAALSWKISGTDSGAEATIAPWLRTGCDGRRLAFYRS